MRIGALHTMQIGDLTEINFQNSKVYKIQVYARTYYKYITFCTTECYNAIQEYLVNVRKRYGEDPLKDKSPLFRRHFNKQDPFTINIPKFMSESSIIRTIDEVLRKSGVKTSEARRSHAFRKGFKSICEQSGMKSINVELLMGHNIDVSGHYYRPAESDILKDYMTHAADALTISSEYRLKKQIELQTTESDAIWEKQREQDARIKAIEDEFERRRQYIEQEVQRRVHIERKKRFYQQQMARDKADID